MGREEGEDMEPQALPPDAWGEIIHFLEWRDVLALGQTSTQFKEWADEYGKFAKVTHDEELATALNNPSIRFIVLEPEEGASLTLTDMPENKAAFIAVGGAKVTGDIYVSGTASVEVIGHGRVAATDDAKVTASGNTWVWADGNAQITALGMAGVRASGEVSVTASEKAQVAATGGANVTGIGSQTVIYWDTDNTGTLEVDDEDTVRKVSTYAATNFSFGQLKASYPAAHIYIEEDSSTSTEEESRSSSQSDEIIDEPAPTEDEQDQRGFDPDTLD